MSGCQCHETVAAVCVGCGVRFTAGGLADRYCPRCRAGALAEPCPGCGAEAGEPCREWCLSRVTDDAGQPVDGAE